jgi:hypothetical protein
MHTSPKTLAEIEQALDSHTLFTAMAPGKWWLLRRNGATKRWKRSPERFTIPIKFGFRGAGAIMETTDKQLYLRIAASRADAERE